uniref:Uncharacterized protein n=1 Tax=Angiostrongylus cantonensis TaxID=6313 RepID=A0A0K0D696_ANGCA
MPLSTTSTRNTISSLNITLCAMKAESSKVTERRLPPETLELIRQRGIAQAAGNRYLTSELAKQRRQSIKEDLKNRRAAVMVEAADSVQKGTGENHPRIILGSLR